MFRKIPIKCEVLEPFRKLFLNQCCYAVSKLVEHLNFFENDPLHTSLVHTYGNGSLAELTAHLGRQTSAWKELFTSWTKLQ